jgi:hypothetical protein
VRVALLRAFVLFAVLLLCAGCVTQKLKEEHRRPYSSRTSTLEDVAYTIEKGAGKLVCGVFRGLTVGLIEAALGIDHDDDEDDEDVAIYRDDYDRPPPAPPAPPAPPEVRRTTGRRGGVGGGAFRDP